MSSKFHETISLMASGNALPLPRAHISGTPNRGFNPEFTPAFVISSGGEPRVKPGVWRPAGSRDKTVNIHSFIDEQQLRRVPKQRKTTYLNF
jgi:hypothetical protein